MQISIKSIIVCNLPENCSFFWGISKKFNGIIREFAKVISKQCPRCSKKVCFCWKNINYHTFLKYNVTNFEIEYFGADMITSWADAKFIGSVYNYLSDYHKIHYTLCIGLMLLIDDQVFHKINAIMMNTGPPRMPLGLFQDINNFVNTAQYAGSTKCISRRMTHNSKLKHTLKKICYQIDNSLNMLRTFV